MLDYSVNFGVVDVNVVIVFIVLFITYLGSFTHLFFKKSWVYSLASAASFMLFSAVGGWYAWEVSKLTDFAGGNNTGGTIYYIMSVLPMASAIMIAFSLFLFLCKQRVFAQIMGFICIVTVIYINFYMYVG